MHYLFSSSDFIRPLLRAVVYGLVQFIIYSISKKKFVKLFLLFKKMNFNINLTYAEI